MITFGDIEDRIILLRNKEVILNNDVAALYGVETREINQAVRNNPDKFPPGYIFVLSPEEKKDVIKYFDNPATIALSPTLPTAFTEKGLYMLATILKSPRATQTTIAIVETFTKIRELARTVAKMGEQKDEAGREALAEKSGSLIADILGNDFHTTDTETSIEFNLAVIKVKHTVKRK